MARGKSTSASAAALTTKSLNDGTGWPSAAAALSRLRRSTASSMSTSMLSTKSGAVAFDSAIRRATVCCRRVRSCVVVSPLPVWASPDTTGGGAFFSSSGSASGAAGSASAGASTAPAFAPSPPFAAPLSFAAASTSAFTIRPPGPVPWSCASSSPSSRAIRRATGEALVRPPLPPSDAAERAGASCGVSVGRPLPLRSSRSASPASCVLGLRRRGLRLGLAVGRRLLLILGGIRASGFLLESAPADSAPSLPPPICAIVSPTGSVSPSWATIFSVPSWSASYVMLALSVSISTSSSPRDTSSPSDLSHLRIVPSSIESDRRGIATSAMRRSVGITRGQPPRGRTPPEARGHARRAGPRRRGSRRTDRRPRRARRTGSRRARTAARRTAGRG